MDCSGRPNVITLVLKKRDFILAEEEVKKAQSMRKTWCAIAVLKMKMLEGMCTASCSREPVPAGSQQINKNFSSTCTGNESTFDLNELGNIYFPWGFRWEHRPAHLDFILVWP